MTSTRAVPATYEVVQGGEPVAGPAEAITILTATRLGLRARAQEFGFWVARRPRWQAENLADSRPQSVQLKRLNFIHTARWVDVDRFPRFHRNSRLYRSRESFAPFKWTLFISNLNQGWEPYLQSFLDSFGSGIHTLWGDSLDYPGYPRPETRSTLNSWIQHRLPISQVFYSAYPHLSTNDVRSLLRVTRELTSAKLDVDARRLNPHWTVTEREATRLAARLQHCLNDVGDAPHGWGSMAMGPADATGLTGFVSLMPIRPGAEPHVAAILEQLAGPCNGSLFTTIPGTHFARLAILDRDRAAAYPDRHIRLNRSWLLFSADFDARVDESETRARRRPKRHTSRYDEVWRYMSSIIATNTLRDLFLHCYPINDVPPASHMVSDLIYSICTRLIYFRDYPDVTLGEIVAADKFYRKLNVAADPTAAILNYLTA